MITRAILMNRTRIALLIAFLLPAAQVANAEWSVPDELQTQVSVLNDEQAQFTTEEHYLSPLSSERAIDDYYGDKQKYLDATKAEEEK